MRPLFIGEAVCRWLCRWPCRWPCRNWAAAAGVVGGRQQRRTSTRGKLWAAAADIGSGKLWALSGVVASGAVKLWGAGWILAAHGEVADGC